MGKTYNAAFLSLVAGIAALTVQGQAITVKQEDALKEIKAGKNKGFNYLQLSYIAKEKADAGSALMYADSAVKYDAANPQVLINKAMLLPPSFNKQAQALFESAIKLAPTDATSMYKMGVSMYNAKKPELALQSFTQAVKTDPSYFEAWNNKGLCELDLKNYRDAKESFKKALSLSEKSAATHLNLAIVCLTRGEYTQGITAVERALELENTNLSANYIAGVLYFETGDNVKACAKLKYAADKGHIKAKRAQEEICNKEKFKFNIEDEAIK